MFDFTNLPPFVKKLAGFILLAIGLFFLGLFVKNSSNDFPIWFFGNSAVGVVEEKWYELLDEGKGEVFSANYFMRFSFVGPDGSRYTNSTSLSAQEWSAYSEADQLPIIYSSLNPAISRVDDTRFRPLLLCSYIPFAIITWFSLKWAWEILSEQFKKKEPKPQITE